MTPVIHYLGHSTVRIELAGRTVLTDPVLTHRIGALRRVVPEPDRAMWDGVDVVLLSHLHADHLHLPSLRLLGSGTRIVVPRGAADWLRRRGFTHVVDLSPGDVISVGPLRITGVRAEHSGHRWGPRFTHGPETDAIGHLLEGDGSTVYVSGDTALHDSMPGLAERDVDVALLPVWGWGPNLGPGHLDPKEAAEAVARIRPRAVVPVHWGTLAVAGLLRRPSPLRSRMHRLLEEPPRHFAEEVARRGLPTKVLITEPGEAVSWSGADR